MDKKRDIDTICAIKERLADALNMQIAHGVENLDAKEAGEVADMIKDLAEAEKNCYEACYYKMSVEAMKDPATIQPAAQPVIPHAEMPRYTDTTLKENMRMGYPITPTAPMIPIVPSGVAATVNPAEPMNYQGNRYGKAYNEYKTSRKHYTETRSEQDRSEMNSHAAEHIGDTIASMRDIWQSADPELKRRMKADFTNLLEEMIV